jgi:hypothetical protein
LKGASILTAGILAGLLVVPAGPVEAQPLPAGTHDRTFAANRPLDGADALPHSDTDPWVVPGLAATIPTAPGLGWGALFAGGSYQATTRYSDAAASVMGGGFGLGDPDRWVGVQVSVNSFSTVSSRVLRRGALDLHLSRSLPNRFVVGVGREGVHRWGSPRAPVSSYAVVSRWFDLQPDVPSVFGQGTVTVGVGTGRFQSEDNVRDGLERVGLFGAASLRIADPLSLIAEWTGQDVFLGASVTPFQTRRIAATAGLADLTGSAGDGARFIIGTSVVARPFRDP